MPVTRVVVVSSCTARKEDHALPVRDLYLGRQHLLAVEAVDLLGGDPSVHVVLSVFSAEHGIVPDTMVLDPYDATFSTMRVAEQAEAGRKLRLPKSYLKLIGRADLVVNLLGVAYVRALCLPDVLPQRPLFCFVGAASLAALLPAQDNVFIVPAGLPEAREHHEACVSVKGAVFLDAVASSLAGGTPLADVLLGKSVRPGPTRET